MKYRVAKDMVLNPVGQYNEVPIIPKDQKPRGVNMDILEKIDTLFLNSETEAGIVLSIEEAREVTKCLELLRDTVKVAEWFLDKKECRLSMYYELKGQCDKEDERWKEFKAMDNKWCELIEGLRK